MRHLLGTTPFIITLVCLPACRDPLPCTNCEAEEEAADDDEPVTDLPTPDLPCGGADLSSDPNNCGVCEAMCQIDLEGTEWEAGGCENGECQPTWGSYCHSLSINPPTSCADICGDNCLANGCAGHTAIFLASNPFMPSCYPDVVPFATFDGACNEPLIMDPPDADQAVSVMCCCK
jgi:hypothetical protein